MIRVDSSGLKLRRHRPSCSPLLCIYTLGILCARATGLLAAQDWAARFPPHPDCTLSIRRGPALGDDTARASLVVHPVLFGTDQSISYIEARLSRLGEPDSAARLRARGPDTATILVFDGLPPGRYAIMLRKLGYARRADTLSLQPGVAETVRAALQVQGDQNQPELPPARIPPPR